MTTSVAGTTFGSRLAAVTAERGPLCVGIDPHPALLTSWGLPDDAAGLAVFALAVVEAVGDAIAVFKPQSAFFERHGSRGIAVLERTIEAIRDRGAIALLDVKRGDMESTMQAYAEAYVRDGAPLAADAITVSPYLGLPSLQPVLDMAAANDRGVFVLALTSNPGGATVQHARGADGRTVAGSLIAGVAERNAGAEPLGSVGLVVGATIGDIVAEHGYDLTGVNGPLLAPGLGAQGATPADLARVFGSARGAVLPAASRSLLSTGPNLDAFRAATLAYAAECRAVLRPEA